MKTTFFYLLIGALILMSCNNAGKAGKAGNADSMVNSSPKYQIDLEKSIDNVKSVPLSSIGKKIEYIPLETIDASLLKYIYQIALSDSFIFVTDFNRLVQFDRKGKFIRKIGLQGRGPGEYLKIWDICADSKKEIIYILDTGSSKVLVYDFKGQLLSTFRILPQSYRFIMKDSSSLIYHLTNRTNQFSDTVNSWYLTDTYGKIKSKIRYNIKRVARVPEYSVVESTLYLFNGVAHFMEFGIDTLYYYNNSKKELYAIMNLGDKKMDADPDITNQDEIDRLNKKFWIFTTIEDNKNIYLNLVKGLSGPPLSGIFNKQTSDVTILENNNFSNDLDEGLPFWPKEIYNDSILIDYVDAFKFLDFVNKKLEEEPKETDLSQLNQFRALINQLTETSNPVLMVVK